MVSSNCRHKIELRNLNLRYTRIAWNALFCVVPGKFLFVFITRKRCN